MEVVIPKYSHSIFVLVDGAPLPIPIRPAREWPQEPLRLVDQFQLLVDRITGLPDVDTAFS